MLGTQTLTAAVWQAILVLFSFATVNRPIISVEWLAHLFRMWRVSDSNLAPQTGNPEFALLTSQVKCWDSTLK